MDLGKAHIEVIITFSFEEVVVVDVGWGLCSSRWCWRRQCCGVGDIIGETGGAHRLLCARWFWRFVLRLLALNDGCVVGTSAVVCWVISFAVDARGCRVCSQVRVMRSRAVSWAMVFGAFDASEFVVAVTCGVSEELTVLALCNTVLLFALEHHALMEQMALRQQLFGIAAGLELNEPQFTRGFCRKLHDLHHVDVECKFGDTFADVALIIGCVQVTQDDVDMLVLLRGESVMLRVGILKQRAHSLEVGSGFCVDMCGVFDSRGGTRNCLCR